MHSLLRLLHAMAGEPKAIPWSHVTPIRCGMDAWAQQDVRRGDVVAWPTNLGWMMGPWLLYAALLNGAAIALFQVELLQTMLTSPPMCMLAGITCFVAQLDLSDPELIMTPALRSLAELRLRVGPLQSCGVCRQYTKCCVPAEEGKAPCHEVCTLSSDKRQYPP